MVLEKVCMVVLRLEGEVVDGEAEAPAALLVLAVAFIFITHTLYYFGVCALLATFSSVFAFFYSSPLSSISVLPYTL